MAILFLERTARESPILEIVNVSFSKNPKQAVDPHCKLSIQATSKKLASVEHAPRTIAV